MQAVEFDIIRSSDRELLDIIAAMAADVESGIQCQMVRLTYLSDGQRELAAGNLKEDDEANALAEGGVRIYRNVLVETTHGSLVITRCEPTRNNVDNKSAFDKVTVNPPRQNPTDEQSAALIAFSKRHLNAFTIDALGSFLGEDAARHYEARDAALARLESLVAQLTRDLSDSRERQEDRLAKKSDKLEENAATLRKELRAESDARHADLDTREKALDDREESLNLQAPLAERRQVRKDLKSTLEEWSTSFEVTEKTSKLRLILHALCISLLVIFGTASGYLLVQQMMTTGSTISWPVYIKQAAFGLLFVTTALFYARWNVHWFEKRANEEFRLKRIQLDFDRASWIVELLFQWQEGAGDQPLPTELLDRLTVGLFTGGEADSPPQHPYEQFAQAILAASRVKAGTSGVDLEFDPKSLKRMKQGG